MPAEQLRAGLEAAGWRIDRDSMRDPMNRCDWYAWMPKRPADWPDCECNDKPPSLVIWPSYLRLPDGREMAGVEFEVTGESGGRWFKLRMYSVQPNEALAAAEEAVAGLGAAWTAIATTFQPPQKADSD
jgi:hypothetical protein